MDTFSRGSVVQDVLSVVVLGLVVLANPVLAQKADRPNVKVGDQWRFVVTPSTSPNLTWVVRSVTPAGIEGTENGEPLLLTPDLNVLESPRRKDSDRRLLNFPLEVGKAWSYDSDYLLKDTGVNGRGDYSVTVLLYGKVRVPAGEFDAFKLESRGSFKGMSRAGPVSGLISTTYWYAPAVRAIVKEEVRDPYRGPYTFELVEFKLQP